MTHIANHIEAKDKQLVDILTNNRFKIDVFQREYRWKRNHVEALISDLYSNFMVSYHKGTSLEDVEGFDYYYMGPIVLCQEGNNGLSIIDGQQRLTSLSLLLIFMSHFQTQLMLPEEEQHDFADYLYVKKGGRKTLVLDVPSRNEVVELLIDKEKTADIYEQLQPSDESVVNIIDRYDDIATLFPEELKDKEVFPLFAEWLLHNVTLVEIKAFSLDNAYIIFETMNDRGMSLNPTEIVKAFLLSKMENEQQAEEMNNAWKDRMMKIKAVVGDDGDMSFFRAWLRSKYANTKRSKTANSENEDFENIGTQFHSWLKGHLKQLFLIKPKDYYLFVKSDFDFFSNLFLTIATMRKDKDSNLNLVSNYCIADSLYIPLLMAPICKVDETETIKDKIEQINLFVDSFINIRTLSGRSVTQSTIRDTIYDLVKEIRNLSKDELEEVLKSKYKPLDEFYDKMVLGNYSPAYMHYFLARIKFNDQPELSFESLLRSRKHDSYVLYQIIQNSDYDNNETRDYINNQSNLVSVANYCLVKRYDLDSLNSMPKVRRIKFLEEKGYIEKFDKYIGNDDLFFWKLRNDDFMSKIKRIWLE